jgi:hypothetical protein
MSRRPFDAAQGGPVPGMALLWMLAGVSFALLAYEALTLVGSVWRPLLANPQVLQTDFHYYYDAAVRFAANRAELYRSSDDVIAGFAYPPPAIVPFMWLSRLPLGAALVVMTVLSYAVLAGVIVVWAAHLRRQGWRFSANTQWLVTVIVVALGPVYMNAIFGQVNAFVLASAVGFVVLAPSAAAPAGAALALGVLLKIYPALLSLIGLWNRATRRALVWSLAAAAAIITVLLSVIPAASYSAYLNVLRARGNKTAIHITNQSLVAFVERLKHPPGQFLNWTGEQAVTVGSTEQVLSWIVVLAIVALLAQRAGRGQQVASAAGMIALIAIAAPLGWGHTYVMILPLVMAQAVAMSEAPPLRSLTIAVCVVCLMIPAGKRVSFIEDAPALIQNLFYSRYLFASLALILLPMPEIGRTTKISGTSDS